MATVFMPDHDDHVAMSLPANSNRAVWWRETYRGAADSTSIADGDSPVARPAIRVKVPGGVCDRLALIDAFRPRASLVVENFVLRQQLAVLKRARPRPPLRPVDRAFWVVVSRVWWRWADALAIVKPATVITYGGWARFVESCVIT